MIYLSHSLVGLGVILLQTTVFPHIHLFAGCYDLLIVQVVYLGLNHTTRESLLILALLGVAMDSLTGGPYGVYLMTYIWLFMSVRWALIYLRLSNTIILPFVVVYGVLMENLLNFIGAVSMNPSADTIAQMTVRPIAFELLWAIVTGPFLLFLLGLVLRKSRQMARRVIVVGKNG